MRKLITFILLWVVLLEVQAQNVLRVNNNPDAQAEYTNLQTAITAAVANDFIVVEGSATTYGDININKPLTITGPGYYFTGQTLANPVVQANQLNVNLNHVTLSTGSEGTVLEGLVINSSIRNNISGTFYTVNNVTVKRCYVNTFNIGGTTATVQGPSSGWKVMQSEVAGALNLGHASNFQITNTILRSLVNIHHRVTVSVINSVFSATSGNTNICNYNFGENSSLAVVNTIFNNNNAAINLGIPSRGNSITFSHNLFRSTGINITSGNDVIALPEDNGNKFDVDMNFIFQGTVNNSGDGRWRLAVGSQAIGAGVAGVDCGIFGGGTPYVLSAIPPVPVITNMTTNGGGTATSPLKVTVNSTSNQ